VNAAAEVEDELPTSPETPLALGSPRSVVRALSPGMRGVDTLTPLTAENCRSLRQAGYQFVGRYLHNLTLAELAGILAAGLGFFGIRYAHMPGWAPSGDLGASDGATTVNKAKALGLPAGVGIVCDLEGCARTSTATDVEAYLSAWQAAVVAAGYVAILYVGFECVLSGAQLAALPGFTHYWRSCSIVPEPAVGFCMLQARPGNLQVLGLEVDVDFVEQDFHSPPRTPPALWAA
jgi:hypothetical protein